MKRSKNEKNCLNYIQQYFYPNVDHLTHDLSLPVQKFVSQMLYGIINSKSSIVQQVAGVQNETIGLKKTCERLYNNLKREFLHSKLMLNNLIINTDKINESTPIFLDLSDINKEGATAMKGLAKVWDGSEGKMNPGYFTLQASTCDLDNTRRLKLLYSELFSIKEEETSENEKIINLISEISILSKNKGVFVGDRGFDRGKLITFMIENNFDFIFRGDKRHLIYNDKSMSYYEIAKELDLKFEVISKGRTFKVGISKVGFTLPNPPSQKYNRKRTTELYFVVSKERGKGFTYYLCSFEKDYSEDKLVDLVVKYYGMRWGIEEIHEHIKDNFNWEKMQLLTYKSLKNMNALVWLAASFIYNEVSKITLYLVKRMPHKMLWRKNAKELFKNLIYRLTTVTSYLFGHFAVNPLKKYSSIYGKYYKNNLQITLEARF